MDDAHHLADGLTRLLVQLIRAALPAEDAARVAPRREALRLHGELRTLAGADAPGTVSLDGPWTRAVAAAEDPGLDARPLGVSKQLPASCPLALGDLVGPTLALSDLEDTIRGSASTG